MSTALFLPRTASNACYLVQSALFLPRTAINDCYLECTAQFLPRRANNLSQSGFISFKLLGEYPQDTGFPTTTWAFPPLNATSYRKSQTKGVLKHTDNRVLNGPLNRGKEEKRPGGKDRDNGNKMQMR